MSSLSYSDFILTNEEKRIKDEKTNKVNEVRSSLIDKTVKEHGLIKLKSDYLDMSSFYFNPKTKEMYKVDNIGSAYNSTLFNVVKNEHIMQINPHIFNM